MDLMTVVKVVMVVMVVMELVNVIRACDSPGFDHLFFGKRPPIFGKKWGPSFLEKLGCGSVY